MAEGLGVTDRTVRAYVEELEQANFFTITKRYGIGEYAHNVYHLDYLSEDYFVIEPEFITDKNIALHLKGLLLLMKTYCVKGTNYLQFSSKEALAKLLHIGKNTLPVYLQELEENGLIRFIDDTLHLPCQYFKLSIIDGIDNRMYETVYQYCLSKDSVPPYKDADTYDIGAITAHFDTTDDLLKTLEARCSKLPRKVSFAYLTETLLNKRIGTRVKPTYEITL